MIFEEQKNRLHALIPFETICNAVNGDTEAIQEILQHYNNYIGSLSVRPFYTEQNGLIMSIDEELRLILQTQLIFAILNFNID